MPATTASAPGKTILVGEHAVVYNQPAIAVPVAGVRIKVILQANPLGASGEVHIIAPDVSLDADLNDLKPQHPLRFAIQTVLDHFQIAALPALQVRINSTIPPASGMGSSAAVSVALIRGVSAFIGHPLDDVTVNRLAYQVETLQHGNPSGIDNTVITYARPIFFTRESPFEVLQVAEPVSLVIAGSGIRASTAEMVAGVHRRRQDHPRQYLDYFNQMGAISRKVRQALEQGPVTVLGSLLTENQRLLEKIGVSNATLEKLVDVAIDAGALGAKLTGSGGGGNIIAQAGPGQAEKIAEALKSAGAVSTAIWTIPANKMGA